MNWLLALSWWLYQTEADFSWRIMFTLSSFSGPVNWETRCCGTCQLQVMCDCRQKSVFTLFLRPDIIYLSAAAPLLFNQGKNHISVFIFLSEKSNYSLIQLYRTLLSLFIVTINICIFIHSKPIILLIGNF